MLSRSYISLTGVYLGILNFKGFKHNKKTSKKQTLKIKSMIFIGQICITGKEVTYKLQAAATH